MANPSPFQQMTEYLDNNYKFVHNAVLNRIANVNAVTQELEYIDEYTLNSIWVELLRGRMDISKSMLMAFLTSEASQSFDPFESYFRGLPEWRVDQPDYIQQLADTVTVPEAFRDVWSMYLRKWLIAAVGCSIDEKVVNQQVLVLIGDQGIGKTKWTEKLVPNDLKEYYFSGDINPGDKDSSINLSECFIINLDELGNLNRGDLNRLKQLITQSSLRIRRPYAMMHEKMPRRASLIGSVNNSEFLRDETGNRRYLCMEALSINYNHDVNMDLVYAQAYALFIAGERFWLNQEEIKVMNLYNNQYKVQFAEIEYVNEFFEPCERDDKDGREMTVTEIQRYLREHGEHIFNVSIRQLGIALKASNYVPLKKNGGTKYYKVKLKNMPLPKG